MAATSLTSSRRSLFVALVLAGTAALFVASSHRASATAPAGADIQIVAAGTRGNTLSWTASYSCRGKTTDTVTVTATDRAGNQGSQTVSVACPATGRRVRGSFTPGLILPTWGRNVTISAAIQQLLGPVKSHARAYLVDNHLRGVSLDGDSVVGGALQLNGTVRCDQPGVAGELRISASERAVGGGTVSGSTTVSITCPSTPDAANFWTETVTASAAAAFRHGADAHVEVDFTSSADGKTAVLEVTASV